MEELPIVLILVLLVVASIVGLVVSVPLTGVLIRFRANYTPKGLQLDSEGQAQPHVGPVIPNFFAMLLRVKRIEGWQGLLKGSMPNAISSIIIVFFVIMIGATMSMKPGGANSPTVDNSFHLLFYVAFLVLLTTPFTVLVNRAITTPHKLPWFAPRKSLQILLTPYELHRPWMIYLAPGLLASRCLHILWVILIQRGVRGLLLPSMEGKDLDSLPPFRTGIFIVFLVVSAVMVLTPLEVITTRLSVQRNHSQAAGFGAVPQDEQPDMEYAGQDEDVIALRPEDNPYEGFTHCAKSILQEEGPEALLRAWWVTVILSLSGAFS